MKKKLLYIILVVALTIILPLSGYIFYSISTLKENEEIIQDTYTSQLEGILFSVNQYSNDFMAALMSKIESQYNSENGTLGEEGRVLSERDGFIAFGIIPLDPQNPHQIIMDYSESENLSEIINQLPAEQSKTIQRLSQYFETGYRKLEPAGIIKLKNNSYQILMAILNIPDAGQHIFIGLIEPLAFVNEVLKPKMQEVVDEQMIVVLAAKRNQEILFSTAEPENEADIVFREMWLFPEYLVGITPINATIKDLVEDRRKYNLLAIIFLIVLMLAGLTFLLRSINREMTLSQHQADFVSSVSHELRTPLALISMFAETLMLDRVPSEKKKKEYYEIIFKETHRLSNIVSRILNFSKIEAQKRVYAMERVDLNQLTEEIMRDYSYHLDQNGFTSKLVTADDELIINCDREAIYEGVVNLIDNAVKYSPNEKHIEVSVGQNKTQAWVSVKDRGIGIPQDKTHQIFEKFYRATEKDIYKAKGAGLGLTILKHIMDAHRGEIKVRSTEGEGSEFLLIFNKKSETHAQDTNR